MTITPDRIVALYHERKTRDRPLHARMAEIRAQYQGEMVIPLPELDSSERAAVANLITTGIDQMAMRVASTVPSITYPPLKPGNDRSEDYARIRRLANYGWWQANRFDRKQRKRARWLIGYAAAPVLIRPDFNRKIPQWFLADPLCTFPAPMADPDDICPSDAILAYRRHLGWLTLHHPRAAAQIELGKDPSPDTTIEVLEYIDGEEGVVIAVGRQPEAAPSNPFFSAARPSPPGLPWVELVRYPNRTGRCTLIYPTRPSLDRPTSQFDSMPAVYQMQAKIFALWKLAAERQIFPDTWFVSRPNDTVEVVEYPDGRAGTPGRVRGGDLKEITAQSPPEVMQLLQMMQDSQRITAGISQAFGGDEPSQVRTGRAGEQLLSATIDVWVQEAQETLGAAYQEENSLAVAIAKTYFGSDPKSFYISYSGSKSDKGPVDYIPDVHFETDNNIVSWPAVGADINSMIIGFGQRVGIDEMSLRSVREKDPMIDDPIEEERRLTAQSLYKAFMASLDQQVAQGQIGPLEIAKFVQEVESGTELYAAYQTIHEQAQADQAAAQQPPEQGGPQPGSPQAQPGLAAPGQVAAQGLPGPGPAAGVSQPQPGMAHMQQLLQSLKQPTQPAQPQPAR